MKYAELDRSDQAECSRQVKKNAEPWTGKEVCYAREIKSKIKPDQDECWPRKKDRKKVGLEAWSALLAGAHTIFLLEREALSTSLLLCLSKIFWQGNSNYLSLLRYAKGCSIMHLKI
jgi:hypothetical protein